MVDANSKYEETHTHYEIRRTWWQQMESHYTICYNYPIRNSSRYFSSIWEPNMEKIEMGLQQLYKRIIAKFHLHSCEKKIIGFVTIIGGSVDECLMISHVNSTYCLWKCNCIPKQKNAWNSKSHYWKAGMESSGSMRKVQLFRNYKCSQLRLV